MQRKERYVVPSDLPIIYCDTSAFYLKVPKSQKVF